MTAPPTPHSAPDEDKVAIGCLLFFAYNVVLPLAFGVMAGDSFRIGAIVFGGALLLGNLVVPLIAYFKGRRRLAAGWAIGMGVLVVILGMCMVSFRGI